MILNHLISTWSPSRIETLIPLMDSANMDQALSLHNGSHLHLLILDEASIKGYIEILDKYLTDADIPLLDEEDMDPSSLRYIQWREAGNR